MTFARTLSYLGFIGFSAVSVACGGGADAVPNADDAGATAVVKEEQFWAKWRDAACGGYGACCAAHGFALWRNECDSQAAKAWGTSATVCSDGFAYDPVQGTACLKAIEQTYSECREVRTQEICANICKQAPADKGAGEPCETFSDCMLPEGDGFAICSRGAPDPGDAGHCTFVPRGRLGASCYETCSPLANGATSCLSVSPQPALTNPAKCLVSDGLFCDFDDWTCHTARGPGERYGSSSAECQAGTHGGADGICTPDLPLGEACRFNTDCLAGSYCPTSPEAPTGMCSPFKGAGEACRSSFECAFGCGATGCLLEPGAPFEVTEAMCQGKDGGLQFH